MIIVGKLNPVHSVTASSQLEGVTLSDQGGKQGGECPVRMGDHGSLG